MGFQNKSKINGLKIVVTKRVSGNSVYFGTTIQREFLKAIKQCLADRVICEIETHLAQPANHFFLPPNLARNQLFKSWIWILARIIVKFQWLVWGWWHTLGSLKISEGVGDQLPDLDFGAGRWVYRDHGVLLFMSNQYICNKGKIRSKLSTREIPGILVFDEDLFHQPQ